MELTQNPQPVLYAVYGTLRQGFGNHRLLNNPESTFLGTQTKAFPFRMVSLGGFPGLIPTPGKEQVITIEVYAVSSPVVERNLDSLEGYPSFYGKATINTEWGVANVYILTEDEYGDCPPVENGDWKEFVKSKHY